MLTEYVSKHMAHAKYKMLEDKTYFGHVPELRGVWANAKQLEQCRKELREVLEEWILYRLRHQMSIPSLVRKNDYRVPTEK